MSEPTTPPTKPKRRAAMPPQSSRVTNSDLDTRLARMEEVQKNSADVTSRLQTRMDSMVAWTEGSIRLQGRVEEHESKLQRVFAKTDATDADVRALEKNTAEDLRKVKEDIIPPVNAKADKIINYGTAAMAILGIFSALLMTVGGYFINQQSAALAAVSQQLATATDNLHKIDSRLTVVEFQLGSMNVPHPAVPNPTPNTNGDRNEK